MNHHFNKIPIFLLILILLQCRKTHENREPSPTEVMGKVSPTSEEVLEKGVLRHQEWNDVAIKRLISQGQKRSSVLKIAGEPYSSFSFNGTIRDQYHFDNKFSEDSSPGGHLSGFSVEYINDTVVGVRLNFDKTFESEN